MEDLNLNNNKKNLLKTNIQNIQYKKSVILRYRIIHKKNTSSILYTINFSQCSAIY